jgi:hypothetical protein
MFRRSSYYLTAWYKVLLEKPTVAQLVKELPALYGTRRLITVFSTARNCTQPELHKSSTHSYNLLL